MLNTLNRASMNGLKPVVTALLLATGFIAACTPGRSEPNDSSTKEAKVVQLSTAFAPQNQHSYQFPATVVPVKTVALNFEVSGRLDHVDMTQGARINKGHLLASVDDAPFERRVRTNRAKQKQARLELERIRSLFKKNLAAQRELDNAEVNAEVAQIALENSIQDLSYTQLVAPFDALISERLVEKDSFIGAGTAVVKLQDVSKIRFEINVSERVLSANIDNQVKSAFASVAGVVNHSFPVTYVEHTTQPDPITQTYKFLFEAEPSNEFTLYPGTRAYVTVTMNSAKKLPGVLIPITALVNRADGSYGVWLFNERSQRVQLKTVEVAGVEQNRALISSGLQLNDRVVSAGISQMSDDLLGKQVFTEGNAFKKPRVGVIQGLAYTSMGGTTLYIEAIPVPTGNPGFKQTGQLGKVMIESSEIAYSYVRSMMKDNKAATDFFKESFIHLHVPAGATPKDGPSAGVTMACSLYSLAMNRPIVEKTAMTGELTLSGLVMPIGGVKEKIIAAKRSNVKQVLLPKDNEGDFELLPDHIKEGITAHFVSNFDEVLKICFP